MTMRDRMTNHLSDEQILRLIDGETAAQKAAAENEHLAGCPACRARQLYLQSSLADMVALLNPAPDTSLPDGANARARLKAQLRTASQAKPKGWLQRLEAAMYHQPRIRLYAELAGMVLVVCFVTWRGVTSARELSAGQTEAMLIPNHVLTPGATRPVTLAEICPLDDADLDPDVAPSKRQAVFDAYGIKPKTTSKEYQVDYLINPQLGGTDDIRNLWPEPYTAIWNARAKDTLERRLHQMVCERQIDLESAQRDIASDWIAAYKKYFHSQKPV